MPKKPETLITDAIITAARKRGCVIEKLHGSRAQRRGLPDLLCCHLGTWFTAEVKTPTGGLRADQIVVIDEITQIGGALPVVTSVAEFLALLGAIERDQH